jgi:hypothetical protein
VSLAFKAQSGLEVDADNIIINAIITAADTVILRPRTSLIIGVGGGIVAASVIVDSATASVQIAAGIAPAVDVNGQVSYAVFSLLSVCSSEKLIPFWSV